MHRIRLDDLPWEERRSPTGRFHSFARNVSLALGGRRNLGAWGGGHPFDVQVRRIPPGASPCPFHMHFGQWELFLVTSGEGIVRAGSERHAIRSGSVFIHPPGEPHQLLNSGPDDLVVMIIADNPPLDACYYPDSDKWALTPPIRFFRLTEVDYFDGEEPVAPEGDPAAAAYRPPTVSFPAPATPFSRRMLDVENLGWESWASPKGRFRGASKELSIALGAKRNTPTGLGGHPFDLELGKLAPGECHCPYHSHAAQWELFVVLSGAGVIRTPAGPAPIAAGEAVLHPPGEAHQLTNGRDADLLYHLVADNPPVDYWHYPDSGKWGLREPRMFFRPAGLDYFDGEE